MIIHVRQACEFTNADGDKFHAQNGFVGLAPEWVAQDEYFKLLCQSGLITAHIDSKSAENEASADEGKRRRK